MAITSVSHVDPVFAEVSKALFGEDVDVREVWDLAKNADAADVHIPGGVKVKKPKPAPVSGGHSNTGRALMVGAAAETLGTVRAGQEAHRALNAGKLMATGSKAAKVAEFGLQAGNLGIGMVAAHKLSQNAKKKHATTMAKGFKVPKLKWLRPVVQMGHEDAAKFTEATGNARRNGQRIAVATTGAVSLGVGHRMGRKSGINAATTEVGKAAPRRRLKAVPKEQGKVIANAVSKAVSNADDLTWHGEISKVDEDKRTVFGWCSLSEINGEPVYDLQDDYVPLDEIEKSAYRYVIESRKGGDEHRRTNDLTKSEPVHTADLIESFVVTPEKLEQMGLQKNALPLGWWIGMKVNDDAQWAEVKAGRRSGFSIHGTGSRKEMAA